MKIALSVSLRVSLLEAASKGSARKDLILDTLGRYSVLDDQSGAPVQPGEGVWSGWRKAFNHDLRCYAALKVIPKAAFPSGQGRQQFEDEVLTATGVHHRNVASIFPLEVIKDSYLYAMEFCNGETLAARATRSGCLETFEALDIAKQIAAGLEATSSAGLLHRNIGPDNVMVLEEDGEISVKVLGWRSLPEASSKVFLLRLRKPISDRRRKLAEKTSIFDPASTRSARFFISWRLASRNTKSFAPG